MYAKSKHKQTNTAKAAAKHENERRRKSFTFFKLIGKRISGYRRRSRIGND